MNGSRKLDFGELISLEHFQNNGAGCFNSAFSNLLILLGDRETAEAFYRDFSGYYLVNSEDSAIHLGAATRAIEELTKGVYTGKVHLNWGGEDKLEELTRRDWEDKTEELLRIIEEETQRGRITSHEGSIKYGAPALLVMKHGKGSYHCVVDIGNGFIINDGRVCLRSLPGQKSDVRAVIEIERTSDPSKASKDLYAISRVKPVFD